jgi:hypothetical protein
VTMSERNTHGCPLVQRRAPRAEITAVVVIRRI